MKQDTRSPLAALLREANRADGIALVNEVDAVGVAGAAAPVPTAPVPVAPVPVAPAMAPMVVNMTPTFDAVLFRSPGGSVWRMRVSPTGAILLDPVP